MDLLLMTSAQQPTTEVLPALGLLSHAVRVATPDIGVLLDTPAGDVILVDARHNLAAARTLTRLLDTTGVAAPVLAVLTEGGLVSLSAEWAIDDVLLDTAGPAELEARLRFALARRTVAGGADVGVVRVGDLAIDEATYTARLRGKALDLTYKEFELLKLETSTVGV